MEANREARTAASYPIPSQRLVSVEHPAIVQNVDRAVDTLQGNTGINNILNPAKANTPAHLILRPEDAMARPIQSTSSQSNNILLKVTVPKRTGRKRKRGSDEPFTDATPDSASGPPKRRPAKDLLRSLRDNATSYTIQPVGKIERTHVFRGMPDFVSSTANSAFSNRFREMILPYELDKLKEFDIEMSKGAQKNADLIPPPSYSHETVPFNWMYRQNPGVVQTEGEAGQHLTYNSQQALKVRTHLVVYDIPQVPDKPSANLRPLESLDSNLRTVIGIVQDLFNERPAWTRRAIRNYLPSDDLQYLLRHAIPYVGYIFRSGPWRDAILKYGYDPRIDPESRHYQTFMFRLLPRESETETMRGGGRRHNLPRMDGEVRYQDEDSGSPKPPLDTHIFKGQLPLCRDGRIWMATDIKDPLLVNALYPPNAPESVVRSTCDIVTDGWFQNGTLGKVKTVMRAKIQSLIDDREPSDADFQRVMALPDVAHTEADLVNFQLDPSVASPREISLVAEVRASIKGAPKWRRKNERDPQGQERVKKKGPAAKKKKKVEFEDEEPAQEQSEGEEEEIERAEIFEDQVAAAMEARDAAVAAEYDEYGEEGEEREEAEGNENMDEDDNADSDEE
ncbi:RNA polymerase III transcription factor subunit [Penicillium capsulatum]|uniref:RNA polymerase III transcription factor subunit n=1 Tax=Penicillium capsulatum TaxID=69766 RepID=A0A9W9LYP2_9EURO|nr:RNA polymerase III transcription factor subunit [Penicillium capsulatum]KAJ6130831.1 RNA polymerase III transcription factor subunit [Penicillium capsulatum]